MGKHSKLDKAASAATSGVDGAKGPAGSETHVWWGPTSTMTVKPGMPKAAPLFVLCPVQSEEGYKDATDLMLAYGVSKEAAAIQSLSDPGKTTTGITITDAMIALYPTIKSPSVVLAEKIADKVAPKSEEACLELAADLLSLDAGDSAMFMTGLGHYVGAVDISVLEAAFDLVKSYVTSTVRLIAQASREGKLMAFKGAEQAQELMALHGFRFPPAVSVEDLIDATGGMMGGEKLKGLLMSGDGISLGDQTEALRLAMIKYQSTIAGTNGDSWKAYVEKVCTMALQDLRDKFLYQNQEQETQTFKYAGPVTAGPTSD